MHFALKGWRIRTKSGYLRGGRPLTVLSKRKEKVLGQKHKGRRKGENQREQV